MMSLKKAKINNDEVNQYLKKINGNIAKNTIDNIEQFTRIKMLTIAKLYEMHSNRVDIKTALAKRETKEIKTKVFDIIMFNKYIDKLFSCTFDEYKTDPYRYEWIRDDII